MSIKTGEEEFIEEVNLDDIDELEKLAIAEIGAEQEEEIKDREIADEDVKNLDNELMEEENEEEKDGNDKTNEQEEELVHEFKQIEIEVNGSKITLNSQEELMTLVKKGIEYSTKEPESLQTEKQIISQAGITVDDLKLLVDAKNGDKTAIAKLAKSSGIDLLDTDNDDAENYVPKFQPTVESDVNKVANEILRDEELTKTFKNVAQSVPVDFMDRVTSNANDLKIFAEHIKLGIAQEAIPAAMKMRLLNGTDFMEAYVSAIKEIIATKQTTETKTVVTTQKKEMTEQEKLLRKKASDNGNSHTNGGSKALTPDDIANMSDEEFEKLKASDLD